MIFQKFQFLKRRSYSWIFSSETFYRDIKVFTASEIRRCGYIAAFDTVGHRLILVRMGGALESPDRLPGFGMIRPTLQIGSRLC